MSGQYIVTFHNQSSHAVTLSYDSNGCMYVYGPDSLTIAAGGREHVTLVDSNKFTLTHHNCSNKDKWVTWNLSDRGQVTWTHTKSGGWSSRVTGDVTYAYCLGENCYERWVSDSNSDIPTFDIYL